MHVNKVHRVTTIDRVAADLGKSIDFLYEAASGLDTEDGLIRVHGTGDDQVLAFTDFGIEMLLVSIEELRCLARSKS